MREQICTIYRRGVGSEIVPDLFVSLSMGSNVTETHGRRSGVLPPSLVQRQALISFLVEFDSGVVPHIGNERADIQRQITGGQRLLVAARSTATHGYASRTGVKTL